MEERIRKKKGGGGDYLVRHRYRSVLDWKFSLSKSGSSILIGEIGLAFPFYNSLLVKEEEGERGG